MRRIRLFSLGVLLCSLLICASVEAKTYTIHFGTSGPTPTSLQVEVGDVINWDNSFEYVHSVTITDPTGAQFIVVDHNCPDAIVGTFTVKIAGAYSYEDKADVGSGKTQSYVGGFTATSTLSVDNPEQSSGIVISLSASPTNGSATIRVKSDHPTQLQFSLFDASGIMVHDYQKIELSAGDFEQPLSCEHLASGQYFLRALSSGGLVGMTKVAIVH